MYFTQLSKTEIYHEILYHQDVLLSLIRQHLICTYQDNFRPERFESFKQGSIRPVDGAKLTVNASSWMWCIRPVDGPKLTVKARDCL